MRKKREELRLKNLSEQFQKLIRIPSPRKKRRRGRKGLRNEEEEEPPQKICQFSSKICLCEEREILSESDETESSRCIYIQYDCGCIVRKPIFDENTEKSNDQRCNGSSLPVVGDIHLCTNPECKSKQDVGDNGACSNSEDKDVVDYCACNNKQTFHPSSCIDKDTLDETDANDIHEDVQVKEDGAYICEEPSLKLQSTANTTNQPDRSSVMRLGSYVQPEPKRKSVSFIDDSLVLPSYAATGTIEPCLTNVPGPPLLKKGVSGKIMQKEVNTDNPNRMEPMVVDYDDLDALKVRQLDFDIPF